LHEAFEPKTRSDVPSTASIHYQRRSDDIRSGAAGDVDRLSQGAAGRDDVFDDQAAFAGLDMKAAPQGKPTVLPLRENRSSTEMSCHFIRDDDAADSRSEDDLYTGVPKSVGQRTK